MRKNCIKSNFIKQSVNFAAVSTTSALNLYLTRKGELNTGIAVKDGKLGKTVGMSKIAAAQALKQTAVTRMVYCLPMFFIPPVLQASLRKMNIVTRHTPKSVKVGLDIFSVACGLAVSMPLMCSLYNQN